MRKTRSLASSALVIAAFAQLGATYDCGGDVIKNPGFDLWCGAAPCHWTIERGTIAKVPTWNKGDFGIALSSEDVAIEQLSPVTSADPNGGCIEFDLVANVDEHAEVDLNVDVNGDGSYEHTERIPTSHWQPIAFLLPIAGTYGGIRFEVTKKGPGSAVVAQVQAQTVATNACKGLTAIIPQPAPNGAPCADASNCQSGRCGGTPLFVGACTGCDGGAGECAVGDTCGIGDPTSPVRNLPLECVAQHARQLGEQCLFDIECIAGYCTRGACSTCQQQNSTGCGGAETCEPAWQTQRSPFVCSPGQHRRATGESCASDSDCATTTCAGTPRMQCALDSRPCASDGDCEASPDPTSPTHSCTTVGVQGGTCQ
jgi:hypothetical protein